MIPLDPIQSFGFFSDYFSSSGILTILGIGLGSLVALFAVYNRSGSSSTRSWALISMMALSGGMWIFVLSSLAFCVMFTPFYWQAPREAISLVARLALSFSVIVAPITAFLLRRRAARIASQMFFPENARPRLQIAGMGSAEQERRVFRIFSALNSKFVSPGRVEVELVPGGTSGNELLFSGALDCRGRKMVAVTEGVAGSLDDSELEAVLAHELAHIKNHDATMKTIATAFKLAFIFDPLSRLLEAAIYRERELAADEFAARFTRNPVALASALLKVYGLGRFGSALESPMLSSLSLPRARSGVLSKQPALKLRIEKLLTMSEIQTQIPA